MRQNSIYYFILGLLIFIFSSCQKEIEKYERPEWLKGKLYTQISATEDLDSFKICLDELGLDSIINVSGSFTVFAPTNEAFGKYFQTNPFYTKISDIPDRELEKIIKFHIVQNSWSTTQLVNLNSGGWVDRDDPDDLPLGFKRSTILKEDNKKYWVTVEKGAYTITDSISADTYRMVNTTSRKSVPFFYDGYLNAAQISSEDYNFFFEADYTTGSIHFAGAHLVSSEIYAENGILYKIDKVVEPLKNAEQLLQQEEDGQSYSDFLNLIYEYARLSPNLQETMKLPGFEEGLSVDTIFDLSFPELTIDIHNELADPSSSNNSISTHNGLIAPTNEALDYLFLNEVTGPGRWPSVGSVPSSVISIILNSHMRDRPVYLKDYVEGFKNGEEDMVYGDLSDVVHTEFASNSTFIGVNKAIVPRAFTSIAGAVYLNPNYSTYRTAVEYTTVLSTLKRINQDYSFFIVPDNVLNIDSSLLVKSPPADNPNQINLQALDKSLGRVVPRSKLNLIDLLFNHIGSSTPSGSGRKEFIENLGGNYIVFDWENGQVTGGANSVFGYLGDSVINLDINLLDEPADNGEIYSLNGWLSFPTTDMYGVIKRYSEFSKLLTRANLFDEMFYNIKFISPGEKYTIFLPSNSALENFDTSGMSIEELTQFIKNHFVKGELIFTDGKKPAGDYPTLSKVEGADGQAVYNKLSIEPGTDVIDIMNPDGTLFYRINESGNSTNVMITESSGEDPNYTYTTRGVLHVINTVIE